jgi:hypothetical protein
VVLGHEAVAEKSNEITAIPLLLQRLELTGALVVGHSLDCPGVRLVRSSTMCILQGQARP